MTWRPPEPDPYVELSDDAALREAIASRDERRGRRDRAAELATWTGTLRDLAERAVPVVVRTGGDRVHRGSLAAVGLDHLAIRLVNGTVVLVATDTVRSVRPEPGHPAPVATGDRERSQDRTLIEALGRLVEERREVVISLRDVADLLPGEVVGMGEDVITVRLEGGEQGTVYLPATAIREVVFGP